MRIRTIIDKEWAEVFKNKMVLFTVGLMPVLFVVILLVQLVVMRRVDPAEMNDAPPALLAACNAQGLNPGECMQGYMVGSFMALFLIIPVMIPVTIAAYSIVGEKATRSLEPLLATPTSTTEIILGKGLASVIPAIAATWLSFGIFIVGARLMAISDRVFAIIADPLWLVGMFVAAPLLCVLSVTTAVAVSSRVNDPRAAEQISAVLIVPVMALLFGRIIGFITLDVSTMLIFSLILFVVNAGMVVVAVKLFQREVILTRWK
jgi:ABC-2 type transport system permease protein